MPISVGVDVPYCTTFKAGLEGRIVRKPVCEHCSVTYAYVMTRTGAGSGLSPLGLNNRGAERRAEVAAQKSLERKLARGIDAAWCPECGHYQRAMIRKMRWVQTGWALGTGFMAVVLVLNFFAFVGVPTGVLTRRVLMDLPWVIPLLWLVHTWCFWNPDAGAEQRLTGTVKRRGVRLEELDEPLPDSA